MSHNPHLKRRHVMRNSIPFDYLMDIVAVLSPIALLPQVWSIFSTHSVAGLSLPTWAMLCCLNLLWIAYGASRRIMPIIIVNVLMGLLNASGVIGILLFS